MEKRISVRKNTLYNTAGSFFYLFCQWLLTLLVVRLSGYEAAGDFSLAMANTNVFFTLATFGLQHFVISDRQGQFSPDVYLTTRVLTCGAASVLCLAATLPGGYTGRQTACILLYMLYKAGEALTDMFQAFEYRAERMDYAFVSFVLRGLGSVLCFSLTLRFTGDVALAIGALALVTCAIALCWDGGICRRLTGFRLRFRLPQTAKLLGITWPLMANSFLTAAIVSVPRSTLERLLGNETLGIYASVATPAVIVQSAALCLYAPAIVSLTAAWQEGDRAAWRKGQARVWLLLAGLFCLAFAAGGLLGRWGLTLLFGESIAPHAWQLVPVLAGTMLIAVCYFLSSLLTITRNLRMILAANAAAALLMLAVRGPMIRDLGMNGVSWTVIAAMGFNALIMAGELAWTCRRRFAANP